MKDKSFVRLPSDAVSLRQLLGVSNASLSNPSLKHHHSPFGHGWELVGGRCRPVRHTQPALPTHLPAPGPAEESEEDDSEKEDEGDDDVQRRRGIHLNLMIQNLVKQNALIRTDHISRCHIDSSATMS